jgi:Uma2 family endonuclease
MNFPRPPAKRPPLEPRPKRFTLEDYAKLTQIGFFKEDDRIELIRGELIEMAAKGTKHTVCCQRLLKVLPRLLADGILRCQDPVQLLAGSEPEPDFAIVRDRSDDYLDSHPGASDILLIIEVADSSIHYDRTYKGSLYAEAGIEHYWIFNVLDIQLEVLTQPFQKANGDFAYRSQQIYSQNQSIDLPNPLTGTIDLSQILP